MVSGLNSDVEHKGATYHVQTEDSGRTHSVIVTHVFLRGAIIASKKTSYADILGAEQLEDIVKDIMNEQHSAMVSDLLSGKFDKGLSTEKVGHPLQKEKGEKTKKSLDEVILDYLAAREGRDTER